MDGFEEEVGRDLQGLGADLVDGVLCGVVVAIGGGVGVGAVVDVDDVERGTAAAKETPSAIWARPTQTWAGWTRRSVFASKRCALGRRLKTLISSRKHLQT